jgi:hypothetical protein
MSKPLISYAAGKDCLNLAKFCKEKEPKESE